MNAVVDAIQAIELHKLEVDTKMPIFHCSLNQYPEVLRLAREGIDDVRKTHPDSTPSNVRAVYMSPWKSHLISPKFNPLLDVTAALATRVSREFLQADLGALNMVLRPTDCWGVIYQHSDQTLLHHHFPSDLVAVAYLEANENCAPIVFANSLVVKPVPGSLVIFPGILLHHVPENFDNRVIVAMNFQKFPNMPNFSPNQVGSITY